MPMMRIVQIWLVVVLVTTVVTGQEEVPSSGCQDLVTHLYCHPQSEEAMALFTSASELQQVGRLEEAMAGYKRALEIDSMFCDAMDNLGLTYRRLGRYAEAITWFRRSLAIVPDGYSAMLNLAGAYQDGGPPDSAMAAFERLRRLFPQDPEGYYGIGCVYIQRFQFDSAFSALLVAESLYVVRESPWVGDARFKLGQSALWLKDWKNCIRYWEQVYDRFRFDVNVNYYLGLCCLSDDPNNRERARIYFERAEALGAVVEPQFRRLAGMEEPADTTK